MKNLQMNQNLYNLLNSFEIHLPSTPDSQILSTKVHHFTSKVLKIMACLCNPLSL